MDDAEKRANEGEGPAKAKRSSAWQLFIPRGVATAKNLPLGWLLTIQAVIAAVVAVILLWFFNANYSPAILEAIQNIPDKAALRNGRLTGASSKILSDKKFLSVVIDLEKTGRLGEIADMKVELRPDYFQVCSLFGCALFDYPKENISIGRSTAEPWWGARRPVIFGIIGVTTFVSIWLVWLILASFYAVVPKLIAVYAERELSLGGSWKLCCVAQLFAALLMCLAIIFYGLQIFDLIQFLFFFAAHFVVAWAYVCAAIFFLPPRSAKIPATKNPFA